MPSIPDIFPPPDKLNIIKSLTFLFFISITINMWSQYSFFQSFSSTSTCDKLNPPKHYLSCVTFFYTKLNKMDVRYYINVLFVNSFISNKQKLWKLLHTEALLFSSKRNSIIHRKLSWFTIRHKHVGSFIFTLRLMSFLKWMIPFL